MGGQVGKKCFHQKKWLCTSQCAAYDPAADYGCTVLATFKKIGDHFEVVRVLERPSGRFGW